LLANQSLQPTRLRASRYGGRMNISPKAFHCCFQFHKRSQFFIRVHNETLSVAAMRVSNPDFLWGFGLFSA
jgi:hypothetical protein